nr:MAG TPA: hypothetical protein [Caudoviricetes sp.]
MTDRFVKVRSYTSPRKTEACDRMRRTSTPQVC